MQLPLTDTTLNPQQHFTYHLRCIKNDRDTLIEQSSNYSNRAIKATAYSHHLCPIVSYSINSLKHWIYIVIAN